MVALVITYVVQVSTVYVCANTVIVQLHNWKYYEIEVKKTEK